MKIALTGASGNITKPVAEKLLKDGHDVAVIGRNASNLDSLVKLGAKAKIGSIEDHAFIKEAFKGADAVYTMIPAPYHVPEWIDYAYRIAKGYAESIRVNNISKVVNLSTYGAHRYEGTGPINSIAQLERALNELKGIDIIHLRAGYFYSNFYQQIPSIKQFGIVGSNHDGSIKMPFVHTRDIAEVVLNALTSSGWNSNSPYYVVSEVASFDEVAKTIGKALGKELSWTRFADDQLREGLTSANFPTHLVDKIVELGNQIQSGILTEHYFSLKNKPPLGAVKVDEFSIDFAKLYSIG